MDGAADVRTLTFENWSAGGSRIHLLDARIKLLAALAILLGLAATGWESAAAFAGYFFLVAFILLAAGIPLGGSLLRTLVVLPFVAGIAILNLWGGDPSRALLLLLRSLLSAYTAIALLSTTPFPALLRGLERLGVPPFLLMVLHFVYRYLFLLVDQAQAMMRARRCRAPQPRGRTSLWKASAGALAVLFARSYGRAERIHHAMLARGFQGHFPVLAEASTPQREWLWLLATITLAVAIQLAARFWPI